MKTKKQLKKHAHKRACSRFEFDYNNHIYECVCQAITKQTAVDGCSCVVPIGRSSLNRTLWLVDIKGDKVIAVYDKKRKAVATFMPVEYKETEVQAAMRNFYPDRKISENTVESLCNRC